MEQEKPKSGEHELEALYGQALEFCVNTARSPSGMDSYVPLMQHVGLDPQNTYERETVMPHVLRLVSERETAAGRPFLSAVIYGQTANEPGPGFNRLRRELKLCPREDDLTFWIKQATAARDYWKSH